MPGLIHDHQYEAQKAEICRDCPFAEKAFDAIEWFLVNGTFSDLPLLVREGTHTFRYITTTDVDVAVAPRLLVVVGEESFQGESRILLLAARVMTESVTDDAEASVSLPDATTI